MSAKSTVSICIPAYNQTIYLELLLESIAVQSFTDYEIIISDDSSTLAVKSLIERFLFDGKLKYFKNVAPLGSPANWNAAIKKASGQFIKIMHHDDAFNDIKALEKMITLATTNNYAYVFCNSAIENVKDPGENRIHTIRNFDKLKRKPYLLFFGNSIGGPSSLLIRSDALKTLEYDPRFIWLVDIEYYTRLLETGLPGNVIPSPLVLTHDAVEHRLTSAILGNAGLQIKEQAMLYNAMSPKAPAITRFLMQVYLTRLLFKFKVHDLEVMDFFVHKPGTMKVYFSVIKFKPLYFAYRILIQVLDIGRKFLL